MKAFAASNASYPAVSQFSECRTFRSVSIRLQHVAPAAYRLQVARVARIAFDLPAQPRHLDIDVTIVPTVDIAAGAYVFRVKGTVPKFAGPGIIS